MHVQCQIPAALEFLFHPARYKVAYGGRGGSKSWGFARALLIRAWQDPLRILCAREFQNSIKESVHMLLSDQIKALGMQASFDVQQNSIRGHNGSQFGFEGLRYNADKIKSYEGTDLCWIEEANRVSKASWEVLIPTIRKDDSEIWVTFNPELETDEAYKRFVKNPPPNAVVRKVGWRDNPWFPDVLREEMQTLKERDEDAYLNIWEGNCRVTLEGAVYANELRAAQAEGRILRVPYDLRFPVHTFWDLGFSDRTSIWFAQKVGFDYQLIDFYQNRLQRLPHYLKVLQDRGYVYGVHHLPHDAEHGSVAAPSIRSQVEATGYKVKVIQRIEKIELGIGAVRNIFNRLYFDESKCDEGLQDLRHYTYAVDEYGQWSKTPKHDEHCHAADALRTLGETIGLPDRQPEKQVIELVNYTKDEASAAWMA